MKKTYYKPDCVILLCEASDVLLESTLGSNDDLGKWKWY